LVKLENVFFDLWISASKSLLFKYLTLRPVGDVVIVVAIGIWTPL
jgi:hypothetical protein